MRKYLTLISSVVIQMCLGSVYAWSIFIPYLKTEINISEGHSGIIFGCTIAVFTLSMIFAGYLLKFVSPKIITKISGTLFSLGYILASLPPGRYSFILLGIGFIAAIGIGFGYVAALTTPVKWFPRHKGLITGLSVAGFGGGAILLINIFNHIMQYNASILNMFLYQGIGYGTLIILSSFFLVPPTFSKSQDTISSLENNSISIKKIFFQLRFRKLVIGIFSGTFAGLLVISNLKPIALSYGINPKNAAIAISLFAIGNTLGRIIWGEIYDIITQRSIPISLAMMLMGIIVLFYAKSDVFYWIISLYIGFCFGANFVLYAAHVEVLYGDENLGQIYPYIFIFYGLSGIISAPLAGFIYELSGSYLYSFILSIIIILIGFTYNLKDKEAV